MKLAIIGATGLVGQKMIEVLTERKIFPDEVFFLASRSSSNKSIEFNKKTYHVLELTPQFFSENKIDYALFSAGGAVSKDYAPIAAENGCIVIDNSSYWRMDKSVPLIVPEVNSNDIKKHKNIISNPNCSTIQLVVALNSIHQKYIIERIVVSTYQSVTGSGKKGLDQLYNEIEKLPTENNAYPYPIAYNAIPHIDEFLPDGYTKEEAKIINETQKIFSDQNLKVTATAVRIPTFGGHSESVNIVCKKAFNIDQIYEDLNNTEGVVVIDNPSQNEYPMPLDSHNKDDVFVGRLRIDPTLPNAMNLWIVSDNLRKGAATNAVQILECLIHG